MWVRFPLAWAIQNNNLKYKAIKEKIYLEKSTYPKFFYTFKFSSIFYPGSIKNISLFIKSTIDRESTTSENRVGTYKNTKILIKQS